MRVLTSDDFNAFLSKNKKCLVMFGASWCGPCKVLKPKLQALGKPNVAYMDVTSNPHAQELQILAVPTLVAFLDGKPTIREHNLTQNILTFLE